MSALAKLQMFVQFAVVASLHRVFRCVKSQIEQTAYSLQEPHDPHPQRLCAGGVFVSKKKGENAKFALWLTFVYNVKTGTFPGL